MKLKNSILFGFLILLLPIFSFAQKQALVFQSDFGLKDGAVSAMKGVAYNISPDLKIFDNTHEIPSFNIWEAAYRLQQVAVYWPAGTVFVSVVDPGVGSQRKSVVLKTKSGHYFVTPDNGTLTLVAEYLGIEEVREIDEAKNRLKNSDKSYTFHGRDVYAYTGARLASGVIKFEEVGAKLPTQVTMIPYQKPVIEQGEIKGNIPILDIQYGNVWTNIDQNILLELGIKAGDKLQIKISNTQKLVFDGEVPFVRTFAEVGIAQNLGYTNSLLNFSLGVNQGNFSERNKIFSGAEWSISIKKIDK